MNPGLQFLHEFEFLEARIDQTSMALIDASVRLEALRQRGPLITPGLQEWVCYVHDLENDLVSCIKLLSSLLVRIHWNGPEMPGRRENWREWRDSVKCELMHAVKEMP